MNNYEIPEQLLRKYHLVPLNEYKEIFFDDPDVERTFYKSFLIETDYICNKIIEGESTWDDYVEEKIARKFARNQLEYKIEEEEKD